MKRALAYSVSAFALTWAASALADSPQIKGSFAFTGEASCLVSPGHADATTPLLQNPTPGALLPGAGFNDKLQPNDIANPSPNQPNPPPGAVGQVSFTRSFSVIGVRTFDGNGNGHVSGTALGIDGRPTPGPTGWPHFPPSAGSGEFSFDFTYTVDGDGGFTATMTPDSYHETFTSGPRTGQTVTVDAIPPITGAISGDGKTLSAAHADPVVETRTFSNGDVWPEICHRSRIFIQLQN